MGKVEEAMAYFGKALRTCKDNETTGTTWYHNFVVAFDILHEECERMRRESPYAEDQDG